MERKPLPVVGDRVRENYGSGHPATWAHAAMVLAILDDGQCIVIKRWCPRRRRHEYEALHIVAWSVRPFEVVRSGRVAA